MRQVRRGVFETNSSSVHSITMCMKSDYDKWVNGELYWHRWSDKFVSQEVVDKEDYTGSYYSYERYCEEIEFEDFYDEITTPNGETVVAFGYYGTDY